VVRVGGLCLFYAWAQDQTGGHSGHSFDHPKGSHSGGGNGISAGCEGADVLVPFHLRPFHLPAPASAPRKRPPPGRNGSDGSDGGSGGGGGGSDEEEARGLLPGLAGHLAGHLAVHSAGLVAAAAGVADKATGLVVFQRYCHVFVRGELWGLAAGLNGGLNGGAAWVRVEEEYYDTGNWCLVVRKVAEPPPGAFS